MAQPSDKFYSQQEKELQDYANRRYKEVKRILEYTRQDLYGAISENEVTNRRILDLNAQLDKIALEMEREVLKLGPSSDVIGKMVASHQTEALVMLTGRETLTIGFNILSTETLRQFSMNELGKVTSVIKSECQTLKAILFSQVGVQGKNPRQLAKKLAGPGGQFADRFAIVENILRTETSTVYNEQSLRAIQHANEVYDLDMNKRIIETIDNKRNHPISQVLNNQVQKAHHPFKAKVSEVKKIALKLGRGLRKGGGVGGIFWSEVDGYYVGQRLPAHYRERGIVVATEKPVTILPD